MSSLSEHVSLTITQDSVGIARLGFGTPLILSVNATFPERIRYYDDIPSVALDGFAATSPEYLAATAMFSQSPHPERIAIGRAVGKPTQRYKITTAAVTTGLKYEIVVKGQGVTATTVSYTPAADITFTAANATELFTSANHGMSTGAGPFRVSNSGGALPAGLSADTDYWVIADIANGVADPVNTFQLATSKANALAGTELLITTDGTGTQTLRRTQNDVIIAQLLQGLNAVVGKNFTATQTPGAGETDYLVVTGDAAGNWFSLEMTNVNALHSEQDHAEPGTTLADDLNAIQLENDDWYALVTLYNSDAYLKAAAAWVETQTKIYAADLCESAAATTADGGGDTADDIQTLAYARTFICYHPSPAAMFGAAWLGAVLPYDPGSETWKFKKLAGVAAVTLTSTHRVNLRAKKANTIQTVAGRNITWEGTTADGDFIDVQRGLDWLEDDMVKAVFGALAGALKIPYTDAGVALIENEVKGSLDRAITRQILASDPKPVVTVPKVSAVATNDKALRLLPDVKFSATLAGAIHKVQIAGTVSV